MLIVSYFFGLLKVVVLPSFDVECFVVVVFQAPGIKRGWCKIVLCHLIRSQISKRESEDAEVT